eukprot:13183566-Alexandrium_andersonii.AAC.1
MRSGRLRRPRHATEWRVRHRHGPEPAKLGSQAGARQGDGAGEGPGAQRQSLAARGRAHCCLLYTSPSPRD